MLAIVAPADLEVVTEVCRRWEVRATVVGRVTTTGRLRILKGWDGEILADVPAASLHEDAPNYDRPMRRPAWLDERAADDPARLTPPGSSSELAEDLVSLLADPAWAFRQYDHQLFLNTVVAPGADAAVLRLSAPGVRPPAGAAPRGMALSTDGSPRWCALDPRAGTRLVVAESALNVACAGARPVALVNCLNFGNPEHPEVMWQLSEAIDGMAEACTALGIPVVGGNVSLYNESNGTDIDPTPVVGMLGLIDHLRPGIPTPAFAPGRRVLLLGPTGPGAVSLAGSRWAAERRGHLGGILPVLDLELHARLLGLVAGLVNDRLVDGVHDVSDGGLGAALAEMMVKSGTGCRVAGISGHAGLFGEGPSRALVSVPPARLSAVRERSSAAGVPVTDLGVGGGDALIIDGLLELSLSDALSAWRGALPALFSVR
jgi:phosphoribosylformylglycinamidine synthase